MRDNHGDKIKVKADIGSVWVDCVDAEDQSQDMALTPKLARKLARKLKRAARKAENANG